MANKTPIKALPQRKGITQLVKDNTKNVDLINKAPHYNTGKFEVIEVAEDYGLHNCAYLFNTFKYISRAGKKDASKTIEDLKKARYYLDRKIKNLEADEVNKELH